MAAVGVKQLRARLDSVVPEGTRQMAVVFDVGMPSVSSGISVAVMAALLATRDQPRPRMAPVVPNSSLCLLSFFLRRSSGSSVCRLQARCQTESR